MGADGVFVQIDNILVEDGIQPINRYLSLSNNQLLKKQKLELNPPSTKKKGKKGEDDDEENEDTTEEDKKAAIDELVEALSADLTTLMDGGTPVVIRLISKPLLDYAGNVQELRTDLISAQYRKKWGGEIEEEELNEKEINYQTMSNYYETNPLLGLKGARAFIKEPWLINFQARAIADAANQAHERAMEETNDEEDAPKKEITSKVNVAVSIPFVVSEKEIETIQKDFTTAAQAVLKKSPVSIKIESAIETPRAAMIADKLGFDGIEIGLDNLEQLEMGVEKSQRNKYIASYIEQGVYETKPKGLDNGAQRLLAIAAEKAKKNNCKRMGVWRKELSDVKTLQMCCRVGMNWIALTSDLLPLARVVAAQSVLN